MANIAEQITVTRGAESALFPRLIRATDLDTRDRCQGEDSAFDFQSLRGHLVELGCDRSSACLSLSCSLLLQAQQRSAAAIWISATRDTFYPPDLAANGVKLSLLPVVWVEHPRAACRAADWLLRSGAFGLMVVDLDGCLRLPAALQARLAQLAHRYGCAVCFLTRKAESSPSLGSMISVYARAQRSGEEAGCYRLSVRVVKDKRRAPVWEHVEYFHGPPGLY